MPSTARTQPATPGRRRSRLAAAIGAALSLAVHGSSVAVLAMAAGGPAIEARPDDTLAVTEQLISVTIRTELTLEVAAPAPADLPVQARAAPAARRLRESPILPAMHRPLPLDEPLAPPPVAIEPPPFTPEAAPPGPPRSRLISSDTARALRVYDAFPGIAARIGYTRADLNVRICVAEDGAVADAEILGGASSDRFRELVRAAILRWRYRPLMADGSPAPFCHLIRISYQAG